MSGKRRKPWMVRVTTGYEIDPVQEKCKQKFAVLGYAATRAEGMQMLAAYNMNPFDITVSKATFRDVYEKWSQIKYQTAGQSNITAYIASYKICEALYDRVFKDIRLADLQHLVDTCGKNYPTLRRLKLLFSQLYDYAMKNDICTKDYSEYVDIAKYKDRNPNRKDRNKFTQAEVERLWEFADMPYYQIVLMLIYNGCRISEFLSLKKENINLEEQYFDVVSSKTENGIRRVPIADKVLPMYKAWYEGSDCEYLLHTASGKGFVYDSYYEPYWKPVMEALGFDHKPHDTRHTCISMLAEAHVDQTMIKKIVGHAGAMSLTERVYTHLDTTSLLEAINKI